ncbi:protein kinase domain-containing protein [Plesiocystis pacifica]|nr:protein kinase [Plesiocystis pacifica]
MGEPGKCPHCGANHPEEVLVCPNTNRLLPLEGRLLDNRFRFLSKLGEGGMSTVWKAENIRVRKRVAIKIMHPEYARNPRTLHRFQNEATSAGRIGNPHICDILDLGESVLGPYIVMEMLVGQSFAELLEGQGRIDPPLAVLIIREALKGLSAAHAVGIIHRDLKPENVFLHEPEPGRMLVKLMDFGISKFTEDPGGGRTGANVVMGTPEYMSPEQAAGAANVDARTDIWAMGVMLYRALGGVEPFRGKTMAGLLLALSTEDPPPLASLVPGAHPGLIAIVERCLAKDADARIQTARAMFDALAPYQQVVAEGERPIAPVRTGRTMALGSLDAAAAAAVAAGPLPDAAGANPDSTQPLSAMPLGTRPSASGVTRPGGRSTSTPGSSPGSNPGVELSSSSPTLGGSGSGPSTRAGTQADDPALADTGAFPMSAVTSASTSTPPTPSGSNRQTWSSELDPSLTAAEQSWSMGREKLDNKDSRPEGERREGGGFGWVILLIFVALIGGGVAWAWSVGHLDGLLGTQKTPDAVASSDTEGEGDEGEDAVTDTTGEGDTSAAVGGSDTGGSDTGTDTAADGTGETTGTGGADETTGTTTGAGGDDSSDDSSTSGGSTPSYQMGKVYKSGRLHALRSRGPNGSWASANSYCRKLKRQRKFGFSKWRMASVKELQGFRSAGVDKLLYWSRETSDSTAKTVNLLNNQVADRERENKAPRAFCVSSK